MSAKTEATMELKFTAKVSPEPQGSVKSFVIMNKDGIQAAAHIISRLADHGRGHVERIIRQYVKARAIITSDNDALKTYRAAIAKAAKDALWNANLEAPVAEKHVPVAVSIDFYFEKPESCRKRQYPSVKPDNDKLQRAVFDALTGIAYVDDGQVVDVRARKFYGTPERVEVTCSVLDSRLF